MIENNIWVFIVSILPVFFYAWLVYIIIPKGYVSFHEAKKYLIAGLLSTTICLLVYFLFPDFDNPLSENIFYSILLFSVFQIGLKEEFIKYLSFQWVSSERLSEKNDLPIATIFYSMIISAGFAITENTMYLINWEKKIPGSCNEIDRVLMQIVGMRSFSSVIVHMACGILMGYFLFKSLKQKNKYNPDIIYKNLFVNPLFKRWLYVLVAIFSSACLHGLYNMTLGLPDNPWYVFFAIIVIIFSVIMSGFLLQNGICESRNIKKDNVERIS